LNWADFSQPVNELYQTADHPALSPILAILSGKKKRPNNSGGSGSTTWQIRRKYSPQKFAERGVTSGERFGLAYGFLMISLNLHDIWAMFFLFLSQELKLVLLMYFGTLGDGYSL
jgi:hypothetical protein